MVGWIEGSPFVRRRVRCGLRKSEQVSVKSVSPVTSPFTLWRGSHRLVQKFPPPLRDTKHNTPRR